MNARKSVFPALAAASLANCLWAGDVTFHEVSDSSELLAGDYAGAYTGSSGWAVGIVDSYGLEHGVGPDVGIRVVGKLFNSSADFKNYQKGASALVFSGKPEGAIRNIGSIAGEIYAEAEQGNSFGIHASYAGQAEGAGISASITALSHVTNSGYNNNSVGVYANSSYFGNFTGSISSESAYSSAYGFYLESGSSLGDIGGSVRVKSGMKQNAGTGVFLDASSAGAVNSTDFAVEGAGIGYGFYLQNGASVGDINGKISVESVETSATGFRIFEGRVGNLGVSSEIYVSGHSTIGVSIEDDKGSVGSLAGKMDIRGRGLTYGVSSSGDIGDIESTADIRAVSTGGNATAVLLNSAAGIGYVAGKIYAEGNAAAAISMEGSRVLDLRGDVEIGAKSLASARATAVSVTGSLTLLGDGAGTKSLTGCLFSGGEMSIASGSYVFDSNEASYIWQSYASMNGTYYGMEIGDGVKMDLRKSVTLNNSSLSIGDADITIRASGTGAGEYVAMASRGSVTVDVGASLLIVVDDGFLASVGDYMAIIKVTNGLDYIVSSFLEGNVRMRYADGGEYGGPWRTSFAEDRRSWGISFVPEPGLCAALFGVAACAFALSRGRRRAA